ncbi:MAG: protein-L-isoaspartate(D-aspartate) O-methyltransferase [Actinomycetota bacterium]|nr:protein-L-isoaspartate(D-aspartate) O-methyltransferase [Actinomycetota bacterium]
MDSDPAAQLLLDEIGRRIGDPRVVAAMEEVPRPLFVPEPLRPDAWANKPLAIGEEQTISQPALVARMCELLELKGHETVLDVGTGSGYHAAVLSRLAARVISIERRPALSQRAGEALTAAGINNVVLVIGDGSCGYPLNAPFTAINVAAATPPGAEESLARQLADGGRMVLPTAAKVQRLVRLRRNGNRLIREELEEVAFVPLVAGQDAFSPAPLPSPGR